MDLKRVIFQEIHLQIPDFFETIVSFITGIAEPQAVAIPGTNDAPVSLWQLSFYDTFARIEPLPRK